jgi:hypothetical protein
MSRDRHMMITRSRGKYLLTLGALMVCTAALAGCADEGQSSSAQPDRPQKSTPRTPTTRPATASLAEVRVLSSLPVQGATVDHLALFGRWVAYAVNHSNSKGAVVRQVEAIDLDTKRTRVVAGTGWPQGQTDWVEGTGNWIFWTDQQQQGSDNVPAMQWRILGQDLTTDRKIVVAQSTFVSPVPIPRAGAGKLVWFEENRPSTPTVTIKAFDTATGITRPLVKDIPAPTGISAGLTFASYDLATPPSGSNLWRIPWSGGRPTQLTTDDRSRDVRSAADSETSVWEKADTGDPTGMSAGDPGRPSTVIPLGQPGASNAVPGDGFAAYLASDGTVQAVPITVNPVPATLSTQTPSVPCRVAVDHDRIAFCQAPEGQDAQTTIEIVSVKP